MSNKQAKASWIQHTEGICGGDACIRNTRHTVAGIVEWRRLGLSDEDVLQRYPDLNAGDLAAAMKYYEQHAEEIERTIREQQEA